MAEHEKLILFFMSERGELYPNRIANEVNLGQRERQLSSSFAQDATALTLILLLASPLSFGETFNLS